MQNWVRRASGISLAQRLWVAAFSLLLAATGQAAEIDFTRLLLELQDAGSGPVQQSETFMGVPGKARLVLSSRNDLAGLSIRLNGEALALPDGVESDGALTQPIALQARNELQISSEGPLSGPLRVRIRQRAAVSMQVKSRVHFNTNVSDFEAARAFYGKLGFKTLSGFPDTNTLAMARAIGIETPTAYDGSQGDTAGGYLLHGELIGVGGYEGGLIDLIEFTIPRSEAAPYAKLNHLGMARAGMQTTDLDADYESMRAMGVQFLAPPVHRADGSRFAIFTDLDGVFYELIEVEGDSDADNGTHITGIAQVSINVSDFERSSAWYRMLGYEQVRELPRTESLAVAKAMGFTEPFEVTGALFTHPQAGAPIELVQWHKPYDPERAYPLPVNHLGIHRTAYASGDIEADVALLKAQGVEFVSPITPCCSGPDSPGSIVAFYDPDGTIVELVEQPFMTELMSVLAWFKNLFD